MYSVTGEAERHSADLVETQAEQKAEKFMNLLGILGGLGLFMTGGTYLMIAKQGALGLIGRNGAIGIRTRKTQASDAAWDAAHRAAAPLMRMVGIASLILESHSCFRDSCGNKKVRQPSLWSSLRWATARYLRALFL